MHAAKHTQRIIFYIISFLSSAPLSPLPFASNIPQWTSLSINRHMYHPTRAVTPQSPSPTPLGLRSRGKSSKNFAPMETPSRDPKRTKGKVVLFVAK
ncbi:hypothetical protein L207DRAFT_226676 [Hyaloscypha variabilis F]|uniref:Uncharacterized protein n=1 Tax=Hyaloscypha variabilis (strain UAMH 11265 / GT02V1 / F) TaxID=1149755 RepID=A0A2J6QW08_HYAVF|nr:hypothetical protein L207DRAFT_226676 [Hyaloscypha variabilis F]